MSKEQIVENQIAYVSYAVDSSGTIWLEAGWGDDKALQEFSRMMYELHSGQLLESTLEFIREQCVTDEKKLEYREIVIKMNDLFFDKEDTDLPSIKDSRPVVKPTQVFPQYGG
tara:strand:- start:3345 stop:3683 length:339 start_codon:yes stop_codon:yes gene_type:complete